MRHYRKFKGPLVIMCKNKNSEFGMCTLSSAKLALKEPAIKTS